jgi:hypothetical protein
VWKKPFLKTVMPILNPDKAYQLPEKKQYGTGIEINKTELSHLIQAAREYFEPATLEKFQEYMRSKVAADSAYAQTRSVRQGLKIIHDYFFHMNTTPSDRASIILKLAEHSAYCPTGFHNAVNAIVEGFYLANSMNELLYRVRCDLVMRTANQLTDDVHGNNYCFTIAATSGYGVWPLNDHDNYRGGLAALITQVTLAEVFDFEMRLFSTLQHIQDQLRSQLANAGVSASEKSYSAEALEKMEAQLSALFHNHPVVNALVNAQAYEKTLREPYEKDFLTAKIRLQTTIEDWAIKNFLALTPHKRLKLEFLISGIGEELLPKTWVAALPNSYKQQLQPLIEQLPPIPDTLVNAKAQLRHAKQRFNELFFTADKANVHWPNIRQLLWYGIKQEGYFSFTAEETGLIDTLMHPESDETLCFRALEKIMIEWNGDDFIAAINTLNTINPSVKSTLIERRFEYSPNPYVFFKKLLTSLHDPILKPSLIKKHYIHYLDKIKKDVSVLIKIITCIDYQHMLIFFKETRSEYMSLLDGAIRGQKHAEVLALTRVLTQCPNTLKEYLLHQHNRYAGQTTLMTAARLRPNVVQPILNALAACNNLALSRTILTAQCWININVFMVAAQYEPSVIQPLLDALAACHDAANTIGEVLCGHSSDGMNALMLAARYQPSAVQPILDALAVCTIPDHIINPLAKSNQNCEYALMIAIKYQPTAIKPIIKAMCKYINLMIAAKHYLSDYAKTDETSLQDVLSFLAKRPLDEQTAFYASWTISSPLLKQRGLKELYSQRLVQTLINNTQTLDASSSSRSWEHVFSKLQDYLTTNPRKANELVVLYKLIGTLMHNTPLQTKFNELVPTPHLGCSMFKSHEPDYATTVKQLKQQLCEIAPDLHLEQFDHPSSQAQHR